MSTSPFVEVREDLIRRGVLSPAARDMAFGDIVAQLEVADPEEARELRYGWLRAGAPYRDAEEAHQARRDAGLLVTAANVDRYEIAGDRTSFACKLESSSLVGSILHGTPGPIVLIMRDGELQSFVDNPERFGPKFGLEWCLRFWNAQEYVGKARAMDEVDLAGGGS